MPAPVVRQSTPFYAPGTAWAAGGTATLNAWPSPTLNGSRIVLFGGFTNNGVDNLTLTGRIGGTVPPYSGTAIRQSSGHDEVSFYTWQSRNTGGTVAAPKLVNAGTAAAYLWGVAVEVTGDDNTRDEDIAFTVATGVGTAFTLGPTILPDQGDILYLGGAAIPNVQALALQAGSGWSVIDQGGSGGSGASAKATGFITQLSRTGLAAAQVSLTVPSGNTRQYAGGILAIPATSTGGGGGGGSGGYGGSPQAFPLGPPDMSGAITLVDPNPNTHWTPTDPSLSSGLKNGVKYIISCPAQRTAGITLTGGNHIYIPKLLIRMTASVNAGMVAFGGGDNGRIIHVEQCWLNPNGFECDAFKSQSPGDGTILQLKVVRTEKMIGSTASGHVHADLFQSSGGVGDVWIEDFTGGTNFNGINVQQEGKLNASYTPINIASITLSGGVITVTTSSAHGLTAGKYFQINDNINSSQPFSGGFKVASVVNTTRVTAQFGDGSPSNYTDSGSHTYNFQQLTFPYSVGSLHMNRVNITGYSGGNMSIRFGARTAQNSGFNTGHPNDDETPIDNLAWAGTFDVPNDQTFWTQPPPTVSLGSFMAPDSGTSTYSVVRPVSHSAAGGTPAYVDWPNWPAVTGPTRCYLGTAPTGDYVIVSGGLPIPTAAGTVSGTAPAPVATSLPVITPLTPLANSVFGVASLGVWSNTDPTTLWTVHFQASLGGTAAWSNVGSRTDITAAQALATTLAATPIVGDAYRLQIVANNAAPGTANSAASALVADASTVALIVGVE